MSRSMAGASRILIASACAVSLAALASAQATQTKETVPAGPATVKKLQLKGEVIAVGTTWLVAKDPAGDYKVYNVPAARKFIIDGVSKPLSQLKTGTQLTADVTTTETPLVKRTTTITEGTVFWASPKSVIVTHKNHENKQYEVPDGFKFMVDGKELSAMELKPGMKLTATKIVEEPMSVIAQDVVVTGTAAK